MPGSSYFSNLVPLPPPNTTRQRLQMAAGDAGQRLRCRPRAHRHLGHLQGQSHAEGNFLYPHPHPWITKANQPVRMALSRASNASCSERRYGNHPCRIGLRTGTNAPANAGSAMAGVPRRREARAGRQAGDFARHADVLVVSQPRNAAATPGALYGHLPIQIPNAAPLQKPNALADQPRRPVIGLGLQKTRFRQAPIQPLP